MDSQRITFNNQTKIKMLPKNVRIATFHITNGNDVCMNHN